MIRARITTVVTLVLGVALTVAANFLPLPTSLPNVQGNEIRDTVSLVTFLTVTTIGAAALFLLGLPGFKPSFRRAYYLICLGLVIQAAATFIYPLSVYLNAFTKLSSIGADGFLALGIILMYAGLMRFAHLLDIKTWLASPLTVATAAILIALLAGLTPHQPQAGTPDLYLTISHAFMALEAWFYALATILALRVRRVANTSYSRSMLYFAATMGLSFVSAAPLLLFDILGLSSSPALLLPYVLSNFTFLAAGYAFYGITHRPPKLPKTLAV